MECGEFWPNTRKSQNFHFIELLLTKVYNVWTKKITEELCVMTLKGDSEKLTRGLKNDIRSLVNFRASSRNCENLHFDGLILSNAYKMLNEKVQKSYVSWHWKVILRKANSWEICIFCVMQWHCVESVQIRSYFWSVFSCIWTE